MISRGLREAIEKAERALGQAAAEVDVRSPLAATLVLAAERLGLGTRAEEVLAGWQERSPGSRLSEARYRWELHHERLAPQRYCAPIESWRPWRARDASVLERNPQAFETRLTLPISIADGLELLQAKRSPLLRETERVARSDLAGYVRAAHTWTDAFALRALVEREGVLDRMRPFAIAIAESYASAAEDAGGQLLGTRFPFHDAPLTSASAMLAAGLYALGQDIPLVAALVTHIAQARKEGRAPSRHLARPLPGPLRRGGPGGRTLRGRTDPRSEAPRGPRGARP